MRLKHNKKRNTGFLFEVLTREYLKSVLKSNVQRQKVVKSIIKEHFSKKTNLFKELQIYKEILQTSGLDKDSSLRVLQEAKRRYETLNKTQIFKEQNALIKKINYNISPNVFGNFVPNYKELATVYNLFNNKTTMKEKMILENRIIEGLSVIEGEKEIRHIDQLTYKTFVSKFNEKYSELPSEQKDLLTNYIASFADNSLSLKSYLNEHIESLKVRLESFKEDEILENNDMHEKYQKISETLEGYRTKEIDDALISQVLMVQQLVRELENVKN